MASPRTVVVASTLLLVLSWCRRVDAGLVFHGINSTGSARCTQLKDADRNPEFAAFESKFVNLAAMTEEVKDWMCASDPRAKPFVEGKILNWFSLNILCDSGIASGRPMYEQYRMARQIAIDMNASALISVNEPREQTSSLRMMGMPLLNIDWYDPEGPTTAMYCEPIDSDPGDTPEGQVWDTPSGTTVTTHGAFVNVTLGTGMFQGVRLEDLVVTVSMDPNPWAPMFNSWIYFLEFTLVMPGLYCLTLSYVVKDLMARAAAKAKKGKSARSGDAEYVVENTIMVMLWAEFITCIMMILFFLVSGNWARRTPFWLFTFFMSNLSGIGFATTILTALFWQHLISNSTGRKNLVSGENLRPFVFVVVFVCCCLDVVLCVRLIWYNMMVVKILGGMFSLGQIVVACYFVREVSNSIQVIHKITSKSGGKQSLVVKRVAYWLVVTSVCMMVYVALVFFGSVLNYMWTPDGWLGIMFPFSIARWGSSFAQVMAVKSNDPSAKKNKKIAPATVASAVETDVESNLASKAGGGGGGRGTGGNDSAASTNTTTGSSTNAASSTMMTSNNDTSDVTNKSSVISTNVSVQ